MPIETVRRAELINDRNIARNRAQILARRPIIQRRRENIISEIGHLDQDPIQQKLERDRKAFLEAKMDKEPSFANEDIDIGNVRKRLEQASGPTENITDNGPKYDHPFAAPAKKQGFFKRAWNLIKRGW